MRRLPVEATARYSHRSARGDRAAERPGASAMSMRTIRRVAGQRVAHGARKSVGRTPRKGTTSMTLSGSRPPGLPCGGHAANPPPAASRGDFGHVLHSRSGKLTPYDIENHASTLLPRQRVACHERWSHRPRTNRHAERCISESFVDGAPCPRGFAPGGLRCRLTAQRPCAARLEVLASFEAGGIGDRQSPMYGAAEAWSICCGR